MTSLASTLAAIDAVLKARLSALGQRERGIFAALCAERLMPTYRAYCADSDFPDPAIPLAALERFWEVALRPDGPGEAASELEELAQACLVQLPVEDEGPWHTLRGPGEGCVAAIHYALQALATGDIQEAAWAATQVGDAIDQFIVNSESVDINAKGVNERLLAHPLARDERARQDQDLADLASGAVPPLELRERARRDSDLVFRVLS